MNQAREKAVALKREAPVRRDRARAAAAPPRPDKQMHIITTARDLFFARGFSASSMEAVAKQAGVGKATLYELFPNKVELLRAVITIELDTRANELVLVDSGPGELRAVLVKFSHSLIDLLLSKANIGIYRIISAETPQHPYLGQFFYDNGPAKVIGRLARHFEMLMEDGRLHYGDPLLMARQFIGIIRADMQTRAMLGIDEEKLRIDRATILESGVDAFLRAYAKPRAAE